MRQKELIIVILGLTRGLRGGTTKQTEPRNEVDSAQLEVSSLCTTHGQQPISMRWRRGFAREWLACGFSEQRRSGLSMETR